MSGEISPGLGSSFPVTLCSRHTWSLRILMNPESFCYPTLSTHTKVLKVSLRKGKVSLNCVVFVHPTLGYVPIRRPHSHSFVSVVRRFACLDKSPCPSVTAPQTQSHHLAQSSDVITCINRQQLCVGRA